MGRSALGDLKFVGRPLGLRLRQGQDKRVALLVFLHFYPAFEMLSQFRDAFQIGFLDDDFYGVFEAPELAPDHARLEPQHEIRVAAGKSRNDAEYGAIFTDKPTQPFASIVRNQVIWPKRPKCELRQNRTSFQCSVSRMKAIVIQPVYVAYKNSLALHQLDKAFQVVSSSGQIFRRQPTFQFHALDTYRIPCS
jgi:hypothetical protein